jgi:Ca2+-binding EF-hand superfamily protein
MRRYNRRFADYVMGLIGFTGNTMRFNEYCDQICRLVGGERKAKLKLAFSAFDHDSDGKITIEDVFRVMGEIKKTDWLIMED